MYSFEIDKYIKDRDSYLTSEEYLYVSDIKKSPQICKIKYNAYGNYFEMHTTDDWHWSFGVKPYEETHRDEKVYVKRAIKK